LGGLGGPGGGGVGFGGLGGFGFPGLSFGGPLGSLPGGVILISFVRVAYLTRSFAII